MLNLNIRFALPEFIVSGQPIIKQNGKEIRQYNIIYGKYDFNLKRPTELKLEAILELANLIKNEMGINLQCIELIRPTKAVEFCYSVITNNNLVLRYIEDYLPMTDDIAKRWDICIRQCP